uniref:Uncharacterized protein n=1 Tax=Acrobeloides nanus TaxID=290746 RepID=A0A914E1N7_9BILA
MSDINATGIDPWAALALNPVELTIVGSAYFLLTTICLIAYVTVIWIFATHPIFISHTAYKVMINMGVNDIGMLLTYYLQGAQMIQNSDFGYWPNRLAGGLNTATWCGTMIFTFLLALNRFDVMVGLNFIPPNSHQFYN